MIDVDTFDIQNKIINSFASDTDMKAALGITDEFLASFGGTSEENYYNAVDVKIRRFALPVEQVITDYLPYMTVAFVNAYKTGNMLINHGLLEIITYVSQWGDANNIVKQQRRVLKETFEDNDFQVVHEGQISSGVPGIFAYSVRYKPMVRS